MCAGELVFPRQPNRLTAARGIESEGINHAVGHAKMPGDLWPRVKLCNDVPIDVEAGHCDDAFLTTVFVSVFGGVKPDGAVSDLLGDVDVVAVYRLFDG
jgi:hypothetical protein